MLFHFSVLGPSVIPAFFFRKKGYINFCTKVGPSFHLSLPQSMRLSVTFLVNVSSPKPFEVATSNFAVE